MKNIAVLLVLAFVFVGCAVVPIGLIDSSTPLQDGDGNQRPYKVLGRSEGSNGAFSLFGFIPFGRADLEAAMDDAITKLNGDALINVRYWNRGTFAFFGTYSSIEVAGDVIQFVNK